MSIIYWPFLALKMRKNILKLFIPLSVSHKQENASGTEYLLSPSVAETSDAKVHELFAGLLSVSGVAVGLCWTSPEFNVAQIVFMTRP